MIASSIFALLLVSSPGDLPATLAAEPPARDHGPGTAGGGLATQSGETLKPGAFALSFRYDYTEFERVSTSEIQTRTQKVGGDHPHFDAVKWSVLQTVELAYGAGEDIQIGYSFGTYRADDVREGHIEANGSYELHRFGDVTGMTDPWVTAKVRFMKGADGHLSVLAGVKFPFGDDDEVDEGGSGNSTLEPALQPGSGAFDFMLGAAYSRYLSERITLDASAQVTRRTEDDEFKIGDLGLLGLAVAYRFTESVQQFPQASLFLEANVRHLTRNREGAHEVENSGGTVLFVSPGLRVGLSERATVTLSPQIPAVQDLNDEQQETRFKVAFAISLTF
jgi:hypothetical protein